MVTVVCVLIIALWLIHIIVDDTYYNNLLDQNANQIPFIELITRVPILLTFGWVNFLSIWLFCREVMTLRSFSHLFSYLINFFFSFNALFYNTLIFKFISIIERQTFYNNTRLCNRHDFLLALFSFHVIN